MLNREGKTEFFIREAQKLLDTGVVKSQAEIGEAIGIKKAMLSNVMNRRTPLPNDRFNKFTEVYRLKYSDSKITTKQDPENSTASSIHNMTESNRMLAEAHLIFAESNRTLAENNKELIQLMKVNSGVNAGNQSIEQPILKGVLAAIVQVGIGKHWRTKSEGEAAVRNLVFSELKKAEKEGTLTGVGK